MPLAAAIAPLAGSVIGAVAGGTNKRPPSLSPQQQQAQNTDIALATKGAQTNEIDPTLLNTNLDANARSLTGANTQVTNALVSRGLGRSGVLAQGLENNAAQSSANQTSIVNNLQNQANQKQEFNQSLLNQLTQTQNIPGQSTAGAISAGAASPLAYALQMAKNGQTSSGPTYPGGNTSSYYDSTGTSENDLLDKS